MVSGSEMRVGDAERESLAAELREHYASGRLTLEELNERLDKAFAAKTRGDLDALMRDLPSTRPSGAGQSGASRPGGPGWAPAAGWTGPGSGWTGPGSGWTGPGGTGWGPNAGRQAGRAVGAMVMPFLVLCTLLVVGGLGVAGIGTGRPIGIVLILAALALLRRLIFRRRVRTRGPRRR